MKTWNVEMPGGLQEQIPASQLLRWWEFYDIEPYGPKADRDHLELCLAVGFQKVTNSIISFAAGLGGAKRIKSIPVEDFMPSMLIEKERKRLDEIKRKRSKKRDLERDNQREELRKFKHEIDMMSKIGTPVKESGEKISSKRIL